MTPRPIPPHDVALVDQDGKMTVDWYLYFKGLSIAGLVDVSKTAPANGQVLIWNSASGLWLPGAN